MTKQSFLENPTPKLERIKADNWTESRGNTPSIAHYFGATNYITYVRIGIKKYNVILSNSVISNLEKRELEENYDLVIYEDGKQIKSYKSNIAKPLFEKVRLLKNPKTKLDTMTIAETYNRPGCTETRTRVGCFGLETERGHY